MSTALQTQTAPQMSDAIEAALMNGDLSKLDTAGRLQYYKGVCESLGLNPLTQPFAYIVLNGKLTLYAKRDCAEQLRKIHGVSITAFKAEQIGDLFVCTATGQNREGRTDTSTGAVPIKGLSGENLANAMMKAETKSKRRLTLSLCGLGLLDETEVEGQSFAQPAPPPADVPQNRPVMISAPKTVQKQLKDSLSFQIDGNVVTAPVLDAVEKMTKPGKNGSRQYMFVQIDGSIEGADFMFCYHASLFDAIKASRGEVCRFKWEKKGDWLTIEDVLSVGEQPYRDGKPENADAERADRLEITDDDIPF